MIPDYLALGYPAAVGSRRRGKSQADALKTSTPTPSEPSVPESPAGLVIGSGKGGVGKSVVAAVFAQALAARGLRVLLVDGSQNLGHLHVLLGIPVEARLEHVHRGEVDPAALIRQVTEGLWLLPSDSGAEGLYGLAAVDQARLHHRLAGVYVGFDVVVLDAGPSVEAVVRLAMMGGTRLLVVTVPEATALTDAYALIKLVNAQLPALPIDILVNRIVDATDATQTFERLAKAVERSLGRWPRSVGGLPETPGLRDAMRRAGGLRDSPTATLLRRAMEEVVAHYLPLDALHPRATHSAGWSG